MKVRFKKFEPTVAFKKLFGRAADSNQKSADAGLEYYYKRGNTYYFRAEDGHRISVNYQEPQSGFVRGQRYHIDPAVATNE